MAGIAILAFGSNLALAETVSVPASVTVNNAIDFTFTGTLNFGEVRANYDPAVAGNLCSGLTIPANPASSIRALNATDTDAIAECPTAGVSAMQAIGGTVERPVFTIAGIAPFTTLNITMPDTSAAPLNLTAATAPPGGPEIDMYDFTGYITSGTPTAITLAADGTGTFTVDATGGATFVVGATLATDSTGSLTGDYENLDYTTNFDVTVAY